MHWFSNINPNTPLRDIGWTYVIIGVLIIVIIHMVYDLIKFYKRIK